MKKNKIKRGKNIPLKGAAQKELREVLMPAHVCIQPTDFKGLRPRLKVQVGDQVKRGTPLFADKEDAALVVSAPVSGEVLSISRGDRRVLEGIVIKADGKSSAVEFRSFDQLTLDQQPPEALMEHLCQTGLWPVIRQRPFARVASYRRPPKAIYIKGFSSAPCAAESDFILEGQASAFQFGLNIICKLSKAPVHLCIAEAAQSKALLEAEGVNIHQFAGPHPSGNVSTHIACIDPLNKGDVVWVIDLQDVIRIAKTFLEGAYCAERIVALTGPEVEKPQYVKTLIGAPLNGLCDEDLAHKKCISGDVLTGKDVGADGYLCSYDSQVSIISDQVRRQLLGWMVPGTKRFSFSRAFISAFTGSKKVIFDTDTHGSSRPMVAQDVYQHLIPLDIHVSFLVKAILAGDLDEACALGLLECDPEDFALCSFGCPSKLNIGEVIGQGLAALEKEIY
ncbi:Na(+)-translocating NADH-quinone reductase subunit A [Candidatus Omnitrophota bacterium]